MREAGASEPGCFLAGRGPGAVRVVAKDALLAFWEACAEGDSVGDHGEDVGSLAAVRTVWNAVAAGRTRVICPRDGYPVSAGHLPELGPLL